MARTGKRSQGRNLTRDMATLLSKTLLPDLRDRARSPSIERALRRRWDHERDASRTAEQFGPWLDRVIEQVGCAWALSCVFVRTLEDRGLVPQRRIAGDGATDSEHNFFELFPSLTARDYLLTVFRELSRLPGAEDVMGTRHNPVWRLSPSNDGTRALLDFFRQTDESAALRWRFDGSDTRFLGDLYQDLSAEVRERYALLQTPSFVERFILKLTLEPAIAEFRLEEVRLLDPTCGSGHFLLGAFDRLFEHRMRAAPGKDAKEHALAALSQVYGVDINPYAVAIARFRLTLSFLEKAGIHRLVNAPRLPLNLVVADSLLHGAPGTRRLSELTDDKRAWGDDLFDLEDDREADRVFGQKYHAVVGNPPYITCKDSALREKYREAYVSAAGKFALAAPFTERFFQLAVEGGFVGMINSNSFMKREFGKKLIEDVLAKRDLTRVIDTAGAFVPGHGTPTVLLFGRNRRHMGETVRSVLGKRGEPNTPEIAEQGLVWSSIERHYNDIGFDDDYISVAEVPRTKFDKHPWSLSGGGAGDLKEKLEQQAAHRLSAIATAIGISSVTGEDDLYLLPRGAVKRYRLEHTREMITGEDVRDWSASAHNVTVFPYDEEFLLLPLGEIPQTGRYLWFGKALIRHRKRFGTPMLERGLTWYELQELYVDKLQTPLSIVFAEVATHNHFVLDRGGRLFKQTAPIIKLVATATDEDHLALLGFLNSSTADFYMRLVCHNKGIRGEGGGITAESWEQFIQRSGTAVSSVPIPNTAGLAPISAAIERLAARRQQCGAAAILRSDTEDFRELKQRFSAARDEESRLLARMVALQEELDWLVYDAFGLLSREDEAQLNGARSRALPAFPDVIDEDPFNVERHGLHAGHRPFEIVFARQLAESGEQTAWFERNGYRSPAEAQPTYAPAYRELIDTRIAIIERNSLIALLERPEHKRRWTLRNHEREENEACQQFILDAAEAVMREARHVRSARSLAQEILRDTRVRAVVAFRFGDEDPETAIRDLLLDWAAPYLAAFCYTDRGLEKRAAWEHTWELQRREDAGEKVSILVPPKYDPRDFQRSYWRLRGKLDVPKERFICYPAAERDDDKSPIVGWAGWDHLQRITALSSLYQERKTQDGWEKERLVPLLAGMLEVLPWVKQWHNDPNPEFDRQRLGDYFEGFIDAEARVFGLTPAELRGWSPATGGAREGSVRSASAGSTAGDE